MPARRNSEPVATLVILEATGPETTRALHVVYVPTIEEMDARAIRAEAVRAAFAAKTSNPVTVSAHLAA